jgi:hypothetical protein
MLVNSVLIVVIAKGPNPGFRKRGRNCADYGQSNSNVLDKMEANRSTSAMRS